MKKGIVYQGLILEGRWEYKTYSSTGTCIFENIYNHNTITLSYAQIHNIKEGKDTIGHIMSRRSKQNRIMKSGNNIQKNWKQIQHKWAKIESEKKKKL